MLKIIIYLKPHIKNKIQSFFYKTKKRFVLVFKLQKKFFFNNIYCFLNNNCLFLRTNETNKKQVLNNFFNILNIYIKGLSQGFFVKFRMVGLGFKIRRVLLKKKKRYLKINLGYSHSIFYKIPHNINVFIRKKFFFLQGSNYDVLMTLVKNLQLLRAANPYKEKGILLFDKIFKLKSGKQQQK